MRDLFQQIYRGRVKAVLRVGCLGLAMLWLPAQAALPAADYTVVPDQLVYCTTCHGVELGGNRSVNAPRLAGLAPWYVRAQMQAFKRGWRGVHPDDLMGSSMRPQAMNLSDAALEASVDFVSAVQPRPAAAPTVQGDATTGAALYTTCAACHGQRGEGNEALAAPPLVNQSDWYLVRQLNQYRAGVRGSAAGDLHGATMRASAAVLESERAVNDVVAHINTFSSTTTEGTSMKKLAAIPMLVAAAAVGTANADVKRYPLPGSDFPISQAVEISAGTTLVYHSGTTPAPANPEAERYSPEFWGDTEAQTLSVFKRLEASLAEKGLDFSNVVKMQIYLVGVAKLNGAMDFQGMMKAYRKYFGTKEQPNLPARSAFQVAGLAAPGMLVEIEVVLAR